VDRQTRRWAWKIILTLEVLGASAVIAAIYLVPASFIESTLGLTLLGIGAVLFIAVLAYTQR
jgi:hypothetical protein